MSRGKRYSHEPKLNKKKVVGVILIIILIIAFIIAVKNLVKSDDKKIVSTTYFTVYTNSKWGVIDNNANIVIEPTYDEMIIIPNNKKDVFICTQDVDYENNTYTTKVINSKNSEILTKYENVQAIENYDEYNNLWYEENVLRFEKDGKYGLIDLDGKVLLEANYENIYALKGSKESIITKKDEKLGLVNLEGTVVVPNEYAEIRSLGEDTSLYIVKKDDNYGIYDKLDTKFQEIKQLNSKTIFCVKENDQYKVINEAEEELVDFKFDDIKQIKDDVIVYTENKKYGAYNTSSKEKIDAKYQELEYTSDDNFIVKNNDSYGIIDIKESSKQNIEFASIQYYEDAGVYELEPKENTSSENIVLNNKLNQIATGIVNEVNATKSYVRIWTEDGYKYYNFEGEEKESKDILLNNTIFLKKQDGKYGYIDKNGNVVVDYIYDDAKEQNEYGVAAVKKDGKWGAIDAKGNIVCEINYELDDNLLIDFIGKYHLDKDVNLLSYTDNL